MVEGSFERVMSVGGELRNLCFLYFLSAETKVGRGNERRVVCVNCYGHQAIET